MGHSTAVRVLATGPDVSEEVMCRAMREGSHHCLFRDVIPVQRICIQNVDIPRLPFANSVTLPLPVTLLTLIVASVFHLFVVQL